MKITKILGVMAAAALALMAFASTASATTLESNGVAQNGAVTIHATLEAGTSAGLLLTNHEVANTCTESTVHGTTTTFTGTRVAGPITDEVKEGKTVVTGLTFKKCNRESVVVHKGGTLEVENIAGTTNGTLFSKGAEVTVPSALGTLTCTTPAAGTDIGKVTGKAAGDATIDIEAVLNCGFFLPSALWEGKYEVTPNASGPTLSGVTS